jgi:hypothetical protein
VNGSHHQAEIAGGSPHTGDLTSGSGLEPLIVRLMPSAGSPEDRRLSLVGHGWIRVPVPSLFSHTSKDG